MANTFEYTSIQHDDIVELSAVENPHCIWVRAVKYNDLYDKLLVEINKNISTYPVDDVENGTVVLVEYCGDYHRGIIDDFNAEDVMIRLMDIGCKIKVKKGNERKFIPFYFLSLNHHILIDEFSNCYSQPICEMKCPTQFLKKD